jgi:glutathione S-transferase
MITLFHRARTRSTRFIFLLEELEVPYELTRTRDRSAVDPANPHPHGRVPAISDDGAIVFESPAIALYQTDRFPQKRLGPLVGECGRGAYLSWLCYDTGVLEPAFMSKFMNVEVPRGTAGWVPVLYPRGALQCHGRIVRDDVRDVRDVRAQPDAAQISRRRGLHEADCRSGRLPAGAIA